MRDMDEIEKNVYLSGSFSAENIELLKEKQIKYILSVFNDELRVKSKDITYKRIVVEDHHMEDLLTYFPETNEFIAKAQSLDENVLVHCHAGISRSSTIVLAFIMDKYKMSFKSARDLVNKRRSIWPNDGFVKQLELWEKMGYTLNANNKQLRQHLMTTCIFYSNMWSTNTDSNTIDKYFERRDFIESVTPDLDLGKKCLCSKCDHHLFNELHILRQNVTTETEPKLVCNWTYVEPQKWMTGLTLPFSQMKEPFEINCPECDMKLIDFKHLFIQFWCDCLYHKGQPKDTLRFRIPNQKFKIE